MIYDLLDVNKNQTKFKLNQIRTLNFQLELFDTAVTLKYIQGHWKLYDRVSSVNTTMMQCLTFITSKMSEKNAALKFLPHTDNWPA